MRLILATPVLLAILSTGAGATTPGTPLLKETAAATALSATGAAALILEARRSRGREADDGAGHA